MKPQKISENGLEKQGEPPRDLRKGDKIETRDACYIIRLPALPKVL